ncbi:hypothetical protein BJ742DRAFT_865569 [Cladochytrium replicatum]|nr:hypothetical protein BJ742DRAFT_865569 [Cladochytrium replicatum]
MFNWFFARNSSAQSAVDAVIADEWIIVDESQHSSSEHKSDRPSSLPDRSATPPPREPTPITPTLPPTVSSPSSSSGSQASSIYKLAVSSLPSASPPNSAMRASPAQLSGASQDILVRMRDREQKQRKMEKRSAQSHKPHHSGRPFSSR